MCCDTAIVMYAHGSRCYPRRGCSSLVYVLSSEFLEMVRGIGDLCVIGEFRDKSDVIR